MLAKSLIAACAATALMTGAAMAQDPVKTAPPEYIEDSAHSPLTVNPKPMDRTVMPARPADTGSFSETSALMPSATLTIETVTNGPVPDTAENRAKYGQPDSRAGKMTAARGN